MHFPVTCCLLLLYTVLCCLLLFYTVLYCFLLHNTVSCCFMPFLAFCCSLCTTHGHNTPLTTATNTLIPSINTTHGLTVRSIDSPEVVAWLFRNITQATLIKSSPWVMLDVQVNSGITHCPRWSTHLYYYALLAMFYVSLSCDTLFIIPPIMYRLVYHPPCFIIHSWQLYIYIHAYIHAMCTWQAALPSTSALWIIPWIMAPDPRAPRQKR